MSEPSPTRSEVLGAVVAGLIVVAFSLLLLWHDPLVFWSDDYELSILPVFADVARSWSEGHLPLLSPYSWVCSNLAGEFQYGTFSIFVNAAVFLIWKFPLAFPQQAAALSITHLFVLAAGAFLLARARKISVSLSIFVSLVAALNGWIICWGATDWFGALGAFAWLPWAWWGVERALDRQRGRWRFLWPAPFVYLLVTGGFPYTVVMLAVLIAWLSIRSLVQSRSFLPILPMAFGVALGFGLSAPAWLAIFDYLHGSAREVQPSSAHWQWLVPPSALPGLILPCWTARWVDFSTRLIPHSAIELACGLVPLPALIAGLWTKHATRVAAHAANSPKAESGRLLWRIRWELGLLLLVLLLAMLPTAGMFRWSFRWLPFFHLILALCAAEALRDLAGQDRQRLIARPGLLAFILIVLIAVTMSILRAGGSHAFPLTWILLGIATVWALSEFGRGDAALRRPGQRGASFLPREWMPACVTFVALLVTYLCVPPNGGVPKYNLSQELTKSAPLDPERLYLSVYPPPEFNYRVEWKPAPIGQILRPGSTSMWAGLRFVNGYSPIRPAGIARRLNSQIHGELDPQIAAQMLEKEAGTEGELARIGVDGIIVSREFDFVPKPDSEWKLTFSNDEGRVYHRIGESLPRVRSVTSIDSRPHEGFAAATILRVNDSRNRIEMDVDVPSQGGPALLAFSRPFFHGYQARLNNQNLRVDSYRGLFPMVEVPAGTHAELILSYRPSWLMYGAALSAVSCVILLVGLLAALRSMRAQAL
jgi:hypothetical protein